MERDVSTCQVASAPKPSLLRNQLRVSGNMYVALFQILGRELPYPPNIFCSVLIAAYKRT